jgi:hypothetical protein
MTKRSTMHANRTLIQISLTHSLNLERDVRTHGCPRRHPEPRGASSLAAAQSRTDRAAYVHITPQAIAESV